MESSTSTRPPALEVGDGSQQQPPERQHGVPDGAPQAVRDAAAGRSLDGTSGHPDDDREVGDRAESGALDFLAGSEDVEPIEYDSTVQVETPSGLKPVRFHFRQLDGDRITSLEREHSTGAGPFAQLDDLRFNAALVTEATDYMVDGVTKKKFTPGDREWVGKWMDPKIAMEKKFAKQPGILAGLVDEIRKAGGYTSDRVGSAERALVNAAGNS